MNNTAVEVIEPWVLNIEDEKPVLEVNTEMHMLLVDSGAYAHVCPASFAAYAPTEQLQGLSTAMAADGRSLPVLGQKTVDMRLPTGQPVRVRFQVMNVRRPILSVRALRDHGVSVHFTKTGSYLAKEDQKCSLVESGNLFYLPVQLGAGQSTLQEMNAVEGPWLLLEWCCEKTSRLSSWFTQNGHAAIRLGLPEWDLRDPDRVSLVVARAVAASRMGFRIMVWASLPCTPWTAWQRVNVTLSDQNAERVARAQAESLGMVRQLARAVRKMKEAGVDVEIAFEWPRGASGWKHPVVRRALTEMGARWSCEFDGCRYQLKDDHGQPVMKPWRVNTSAARLREPLGRRCQRNHAHGECRGSVAIRSGLYTNVMVKSIGQAITGGENHGILAPLMRQKITSKRSLRELEGAEEEERPAKEPRVDVEAEQGHEPPEQAEPEDPVGPQVVVHHPPRMPPPEEIERHNLTHSPFRSWCPTCVASRAKDAPHRQLHARLDEMPIVEMDYAFLSTSAAGDQTVPVKKGTGGARIRLRVGEQGEGSRRRSCGAWSLSLSP